MGDEIGAVKTLFSDDFSGPLSKAKWDYNHWKPTDNPSFYGRTQQRQSLPETKNGVLRLQLDTYNKGDAKHTSFLGSEVITQQTFGLASGAGVAFEVKARFENVPKGIVGGIFTFTGNAKNHDEIDWEALSNDLAAGKKQIQTNIYANEPLGAGHVKFVPITGALTDYHVYRMEWLPNQVRWLVDGKVVRVETDHVPKNPMNLHMNIWAPSAGWKNAYDASLQPAKTAGTNKSYFLDATYAKVFQLSTSFGDGGSNALRGTHKSDWIEGRKGDDVLRGKAKGDTLIGGAGEDTIYCGAGRDTIKGRGGDDTLVGRKGVDTFAFDRKLGPDNVDTIKDFTPGSDKIELSAAIFAAVGAAGSLAVTAFHVGTASHDADDRVLYDPATGDLSYDADGTGSIAPVLFAHLSPGLAVTASDFLVA